MYKKIVSHHAVEYPSIGRNLPLNSIERVDRCGEGGSGKLGIGFDLKMLLLLGYSAIDLGRRRFTFKALCLEVSLRHRHGLELGVLGVGGCRVTPLPGH